MSRPPQSPDPEADALAEFDAFLAEQEAERQFQPGDD